MGNPLVEVQKSGITPDHGVAAAKEQLEQR